MRLVSSLSAFSSVFPKKNTHQVCFSWACFRLTSIISDIRQSEFLTFSAASRTDCCFYVSVVHTRPQQRGGDLNHEQNDHQVPDSTLYDASYPSSQDNDTHPTPGPGHAHKRHHTSYQATNTHNHDRHPHHLDPDHPQQEHRTPGEFLSVLRRFQQPITTQRSSSGTLIS